MKISKNGKATGKITFGDKKKSLAIKSGYFTDAAAKYAKYCLTFKDGSELNMIFNSSRMDGYEYGEFVAETDWGKGSSLTAQITQDLFSRADTKKTFTKLFKKHVYQKDDLTFTVSPNGSVKVKGTYSSFRPGSVGMRMIRFWTSHNCRDGESWRKRLYLPEEYRFVFDEAIAKIYKYVSKFTCWIWYNSKSRY